MHPKPLRHFLDCGIKVIPTYDNGCTLGSWKDQSKFIGDTEGVKRHWSNGIRRFQFVPYQHGFICFDIDRKKGKDGLKEICQLFNEKGLVMPAYLLDERKHPAYTRTPSNGLHFYFKFKGKAYQSGAITPGFEVVHDRHLITAPGSQKDNKPYVFYGDLKRAPMLPQVFKQFLSRKADRIKPVWTFNQKQHGELSLDKIAEIIDRQGEHSPGISRNGYTFAIAVFARKKGYTAPEIESYLISLLEAPDFTAREIQDTVKSAFKG